MNRIFLLSLFFGILLTGCAEENFVPGSPMAKAFGYNRTGVQIDSEKCEKELNLEPGTDLFKRCVLELTIARENSNAAHYNRSAQMFSAGQNMMNVNAPAASMKCESIDNGNGNITTNCQEN
jgi:hypothetical protein